MVPAHAGIEENVEADQMAKKALKYTNTDINISVSKAEIKGIIRRAMIKKWQEMWDEEVKVRYLYDIQKQVGNGRKNFGSRKDTVLFSIGPTALNQSLFIIGEHKSGNCNKCGLWNIYY